MRATAVQSAEARRPQTMTALFHGSDDALRCGHQRRVFRILILLPAVLAVIAHAQPSATVTSAASYQPAVAPDSLATLFGANLAPDTVSAQLDADGKLPVSLEGISVEIAGQPAGLIFVSPLQINFWVPPGTALAGSDRDALGRDRRGLRHDENFPNRPCRVFPGCEWTGCRRCAQRRHISARAVLC